MLKLQLHLQQVLVHKHNKHKPQETTEPIPKVRLDRR
jgi:hypothetical protein